MLGGAADVRSPEVRIARVERDLVLPLRRQVLSLPGRRVGALTKDMSPTSRHWAAWCGEAIIGCVSVIQQRGWALRAMAVAPEYQGQGIGRRLLEVVHAQVAQPMWCHARLSSVPFYTRLGWRAEGPVFVMRNKVPHQRMTWDS